MKWAATNVPPVFVVFVAFLHFAEIQCELTISQFSCNDTWNPRIAANAKTTVQSLCNLQLRLSFLETDANKSSSTNVKVTVDLLVTSGFETLRANSIPGVDYWIGATLTTLINLDGDNNNNGTNETFDVPLNHLNIQFPSLCGQTYMIAQVKQPDDITVSQSTPIQIECLEKNVDLALIGETKESYDMYSHRPVIQATCQPISYFIPDFKLWVKNNMSNATFSARTGPSVYVVSAFLKSQLWYMFPWLVGNESAKTVANAEKGQLNYKLGDVMMHQGNRLVSSHGGRGTPSMTSGYQEALDLDQLALCSREVCGNGLLVVQLSVPHQPSDTNPLNNYYLMPVFVDCYGANPVQTVETCKVVPNYYDGGQTAWITYSVPGQTKIFEYKSEERSVRPVHLDVESATLEDVAHMKLITDVQSNRLQEIDQCVDTVSGVSDTFVTALDVLLTGIEKFWTEIKPETEIQKVEHDKISLIVSAVSDVLTLALQAKNPLNSWLPVPFYLAFTSEGRIWEDEHLASNQVSRRMRRDVDEFGDEQLGENEIEEFGNEEEEQLDEGEESDGVEEYAYEANGTASRRIRRSASETVTSSTTRSSGFTTATIRASTGWTAARSTSPAAAVTGSIEDRSSQGAGAAHPLTTATSKTNNVTWTQNGSGRTTQSSSRTSSVVATARPSVTQTAQRGTTPRSSQSTIGSTRTSQSEFTRTERKLEAGASSTTLSAGGARATTTGRPGSGSHTTTAPSTRTSPSGASVTSGSPASGSTQRFAGTERKFEAGASSTTLSAGGDRATTTGRPGSGSHTTTAPSTRTSTSGASVTSGYPASGSTQRFARLEEAPTSSILGSSSTASRRATTTATGSVTSRFSTAPSVSETSSSLSSATLRPLGTTASTGQTTSGNSGIFSPTKTSAGLTSGTTGRISTGTSRYSSPTATVVTSTKATGTSSSPLTSTEDHRGPPVTTATSTTEFDDTPYFGRKPSWHQDVSKIIYGIIKYDAPFLTSYLSSDRIQGISHFFQTLFYGRVEDFEKYSYIPKSTRDKLTSLLKLVLSSSMPRIFDDIPKPLYELIMKWYDSELAKERSVPTGCTFRSGLEMFLNATQRMQLTKEWQNRKDQLSLYGHILRTLLLDDHPEYLADLYSKTMGAWSRNEAWMIRDGVPIHEPDVDDVCKRYTAAKLWQLQTDPVFQFAGRTVSPDHYKSVFWTEDRGTIYRGDRSDLTGQVFWSKVATCSCATGNACGGSRGPLPSTAAPPSLAVTPSGRWMDTTTASVPVTSGQSTQRGDAFSAAPVYRYHDQFQLKDQHRNDRQEEVEYEIHEDLLFTD